MEVWTSPPKDWPGTLNTYPDPISVWRVQDPDNKLLEGPTIFVSWAGPRLGPFAFRAPI